MAARWLVGTRNAVLFWKLVDERKVASSVRVRQHSATAGSQFEVTIEGAPGKSPDDILAAFDAAMDDIHGTQPSATGRAGAIYETVIDRLLATERLAARAAEYARFAALQGSAGRFWHEAGRYDHVTAQGVHDALVRYLPRDRRVVLLVTPTPGASRGGDRIQRRFILARTP